MRYRSSSVRVDETALEGAYSCIMEGSTFLVAIDPIEVSGNKYHTDTAQVQMSTGAKFTLASCFMAMKLPHAE